MPDQFTSLFMRLPMPQVTLASRKDMMDRAFIRRHRRPPTEKTPLGDWWPELLIDDKIVVVRKFYLPRRPKPQAPPHIVSLIDSACQDVTISMLDAVLPIYEEFFPEDRRLHKASEVAKAYRDDPSERNMNACRMAARLTDDVSMILYYQGVEESSDPHKYYAASNVAAAASCTVSQTFAAAACGCESAEFTMRSRAQKLGLQPVKFDFKPAEDRLDRLLIDLGVADYPALAPVLAALATLGEVTP